MLNYKYLHTPAFVDFLAVPAAVASSPPLPAAPALAPAAAHTPALPEPLVADSVGAGSGARAGSPTADLLATTLAPPALARETCKRRSSTCCCYCYYLCLTTAAGMCVNSTIREACVHLVVGVCHDFVQ